MSHFEELKVWQKAVYLAVKVYEISNKVPFNKDFGLRDQMRRSSVSVSSNIAEGDQFNPTSHQSDISEFQKVQLLSYIIDNR